jgi:hypothetical protein
MPRWVSAAYCADDNPRELLRRLNDFLYERRHDLAPRVRKRVEKARRWLKINCAPGGDGVSVAAANVVAAD